MQNGKFQIKKLKIANPQICIKFAISISPSSTDNENRNKHIIIAIPDDRPFIPSIRLKALETPDAAKSEKQIAIIGMDIK